MSRYFCVLSFQEVLKNYNLSVQRFCGENKNMWFWPKNRMLWLTVLGEKSQFWPIFHPYVIFQTHFMCIIHTWKKYFCDIRLCLSHRWELKRKREKRRGYKQNKKNWENTIKPLKNVSHGSHVILFNYVVTKSL